MNKVVFRYPFILVLGIIGYACNFGDLDFDNIQDPNFNPELVAPIGEVTYTIKELIDEINDPNIEIEEATSLLLTVIYRDTSIYQTPEELISIDDLSQQQVIEPGLNITNTPIAVTEVFSQTLTFEYPAQNSEEIDSILYSGGEIQLTLQSQVQADLQLDIRLLDFVDQVTRDTLEFSSTLNYQGTSPVTDVQTADLTGKRTSLTITGGQNLFTVEINGTVNLAAGQSISPTDFITLEIQTTNTTFSAVIGYFGEDEIVVQDQSIDVDFFEDIDPFGLEFNEPEIIINFQNSFGLPIGINLDNISASNNAGDMTILSGAITEELQTMRAPIISEFGETLQSSFSVSRENSNIQDLLSISPSRFTIPLAATANFGNTDQNRNFYTDESQVETTVQVNLPLDVKLDGYTQTFDFDIADVDFDDADSIKIRVTTINDLPFNGSMSMFLLDADSMVIHSVPDNIILQSPEVGSNGRSSEPITNIEDVVLNTEGVLAFAEASTVVLVLNVESFEATDGRFVRIFSDYELVIKLGAIANLNFTL